MTLDQAFAQIQRHEAAIAHLELRASRPDLEDARARQLGDEALHEAAELCKVAREVGDRDALTRCAHAERTARAVADRAQEKR